MQAGGPKRGCQEGHSMQGLTQAGGGPRRTCVVADGGGDGPERRRKGLHGQAALAGHALRALAHHLRACVRRTQR